MVEKEPIVCQFLDDVCRHVRAKELHPEIREELSGHIADRAESLQLEGYSEEAALQEAVNQMGSSVAIGKNLQQAHRPLVDWMMLVIIALMAIIGLFAALNVQNSGSLYHFSGLFENKAILTGVGLLALVVFFFSDYRKLQKYAGTIFIATLGLMVFTLLAGNTINGKSVYLNVGVFGVNVMELSLLLLLISLAGLRSESTFGVLKTCIHLVYQGVLPILLFSFGDSLSLGLMYLIGYLVLTWYSMKSLKYIFVIGLPVIAVFSFMMVRMDLIRQRIGAFFNPSVEENYHLMQTAAAIRSAGWTGHGFAAPNGRLPFLQSESLFPYLIYCFGWGAGIIIGSLVLLFLVQIWKMMTSLQDPLAKKVTLAVMVVFTLHMLWPILMAFGLLPIVGIELPFIAYGGTMQIFYFAVIGLLLSMYRRKNMLPSSQVVT